MQVLNAISTQLVARLPALRTSLRLTAVPLPELQDQVVALLDTFAPRKAAPSLQSSAGDLVLAAMCGALAQARLPALQPAFAPATLQAEPVCGTLAELQASPELLQCLVGCFTDAG